MDKKTYTKPELHITIIDNEISLIMMTDEGGPPDKPVAGGGEDPGPGPTEQNSFNENPFGE